MYTENKLINETKKAEREAAELPPSRSDRWQANFFDKKVCAVRFLLRSAAALATSAEREVPRANGRAAAGSVANFYIICHFLENTLSGAVILMRFKN